MLVADFVSDNLTEERTMTRLPLLTYKTAVRPSDWGSPILAPGGLCRVSPPPKAAIDLMYAFQCTNIRRMHRSYMADYHVYSQCTAN